MDPLDKFKAAQKAGWAYFAPLEAITTPAAARLAKHARLGAGMRVLDVACGTGVVAITAARLGAPRHGTRPHARTAPGGAGELAHGWR